MQDTAISGTQMLLGLGIGIFFLVFLILKTKVHAFLALIISAALTGIIGAMQAGSTLMQAQAKVEPEIINVIQAFILFFVAAPSVVRWILRQRRGEGDAGTTTISTSWAGS